MTDASDVPRNDPDLTERALGLIAVGRAPARSVVDAGKGTGRKKLTPRQVAVFLRDRDSDETVRSYFRRVRKADVIAELQILECFQPLRLYVVQGATKWLAAYFRWTAIENVTLTSDGYPIESLASRFAVAISARLAGPLGDVSATLPTSALPDWTAPDIALGWHRPRGRPTNPSIEDRNHGIAAMWVKLEAAGVDSTAREQQVGLAFGVQATVIYDVLRECAGLVAAFSTNEGRSVIDEVIANTRLPRTRSGK